MYFIAIGKCEVHQLDRMSLKNENIKVKDLVPGDYFGVNLILLLFIH